MYVFQKIYTRPWEKSFKKLTLLKVGKLKVNIFIYCLAPSGPPLKVKVTTQSSSSLVISWKAPEMERQNGVITNFTVCLSHHKDGVCFKEYVTNSYELLINNLSFSTKYFVRVLATTRGGSGNYSQSQEAFTNGRTFCDLSFDRI